MSKTAKRGRKHIEINQESFESLCALQCTLAEISGFFGCSADTIERWCKRTYKMNFADIFAQKRTPGQISLRRSQFRLAEKNASMGIWLGKQYLGQSDKASEREAMAEDDGFMDAMKSTAAAVWDGAGSDTPSGDIDRIEAAIKKREEEYQLRRQIRQEILQELQPDPEPDPEQKKMNEIYSKYGTIAKVVNDDVE